MTTYLLDANMFLRAKNREYGFDFCPAFWEWLERQNEAGKVFSIEAISNELTDDDIAPWAEARGEGFFRRHDEAMIEALPGLAEWAYGQTFRPLAISTFLQSADYYLVGYAKAHGHVIVTHERVSDAVKAIKIPNACIGIGVKCMTPYEMLRRERARFVLGKTA